MLQYNENNNENNVTNVIRKQKSAVQLRPPTLRNRRISGPLVVNGMLAGQNNTSSSSSSPPTITTDNNNNNTPTVSSSSSNQSLSPPLRPQQQVSSPQPTQDYISAYRSSQIMLEYERSTSNTPLYDEQQEDCLTPIDSANCSILSVLAEAFVHQLGHQEIFTGEEAVNALHGLLALAYYPEYRSIQVANALLHCKPHVLFQPAEDYGLPPKSDVLFSSAWNKKYVLRYDSLEEETKPVGVLSNLTPCYVMGCEPGNTDCYAPRCPNNPSNAMREILHSDQSTSVPVVVTSLLHNHSQVNIDSSVTLTGDNSRHNDIQSQQQQDYYQRQDSNSSGEEGTKISSFDEPARQNAILELIRSHRTYCRTLDILHHVIIDSILSTNSIGTKEQRKTLVSNAFSTYETLHKMNRDLYHDMKHLRISSQKEGGGANINKIGDVFYSHIKLMSEPIITYLANIPLAEYIIDHERNNNSHFANLFELVKEDKRIIDSKITSLNYIYLAPRMQMPLYMACLRGILVYTPEGHPDIDYLKQSIQKMERIERESKKLAKMDTERRVQVLRLADDLQISSSDVIVEEDLNLTAPQRRLLYHGALKKSSSNSITTLLNKKTIHVFVLDHMVLTTTTSTSTSSSTKRNIRRDVHNFMEKIPLPMLHVQESKTNWVFKPSSTTSTSSNESTRRRRISFLHSDSSQEDLGSTITLVHLGKSNHKPRVLSCSSMDEKRRCLAAIDEARKLYKQNNRHNDVFRLSWLNRTAFRVSRESSSLRSEDTISYDKVNCSVPLGNGITAVGTNTGIYRVHDDSSTADLMLPVGKVLQMATMSPKANLLLVLTAIHHELKAYTIESIIDATYDSRHGFIRGQSMSIDQSVQFFEVGSTQQHKDLLIYKKKRHNESVVVAVKPIEELYHAQTRERFVLMSPQYFTNRHITSPQTYIFQRVHHENIRGKGVRMVQFCGAGNVALVCLNNFRFFSFDDGEPHEQRSSLPLDDRRRKDDNSLEARAAFYLTSSRVLLCYNRYAYIIDAHYGHRIATGSHGQPYMFKWESEPLHVVRHKDYIIGVSNHFIEIRKIYSGELVQIMHADSCQLTYEGSVDNEHVIHGCMVESNTLDRQQLFQLVLHKT